MASMYPLQDSTDDYSLDALRPAHNRGTTHNCFTHIDHPWFEVNPRLPVLHEEQVAPTCGPFTNILPPSDAYSEIERRHLSISILLQGVLESCSILVSPTPRHFATLSRHGHCDHPFRGSRCARIRARLASVVSAQRKSNQYSWITYFVDIF
ncbi:hypothetical protein BC629DRAFT_1472303 [Irpex lacteus]|nr:hypothetical protein BC629DRAFT_1472303 [Irpex lacteus]